MPYYDPNDVVPNVLSEEVAHDLTADNRDDPIDMDVITEACEDASDEIDTYLGKRYVVPCVTVPNIIRRQCATIVGYLLFNRRLSAGQVNKFEDAYNNVVKWLNLVSIGKVVIDGLVKLQDNPQQTGGVVTGTHRTFTPDSMKGF
jgi:phage gp36-like protein